MSSYLEKQSSAFRGNLASAASKLSNPTSTKAKSAVAAAASSHLAPTPPSPSAAGSDANATTPSGKRKRDAPPEVPYSQPQLTGYGSEVKTQMTFAVDYLKKKGDPKTVIEIIEHLSLQGQSEEHKKELTEGLRRHPRVDWRPDPKVNTQTWQTGLYSHRPIIPGVRDGTSLIAFLQSKTDASGVSVKDLKDGWPDCEETLSSLERQHRVLVVRTKKDNFPRCVWADDASLHYAVQPEFRQMWARVPLPSLDDMHRKLVAVGQKPTSEDPRKANLAAGANKPKQQKKRAGKRGGKATNVHMAHLMQDYSNLRR